MAEVEETDMAEAAMTAELEKSSCSNLKIPLPIQIAIPTDCHPQGCAISTNTPLSAMPPAVSGACAPSGSCWAEVLVEAPAARPISQTRLLAPSVNVYACIRSAPAA